MGRLYLLLYTQRQMKLAILGGDGQVGTAVSQWCRQHGISYISFNRKNIDITIEMEVLNGLSQAAPTVVINAAAYTNVEKAESELELAFRVNDGAAGTVAKVCDRLQIPLLHLSTDYVFDGRKGTPYVENDPVAPLGAYARSKEAGERSITKIIEKHIILRTGWVYGPYGHNFFKTMLRLAETRDSIDVVEDQIGNPTATSDLAIAIGECCRKVHQGAQQWGIYHFVGRGDATRYEFAKEIIEGRTAVNGRRVVVHPIATAEFPTAVQRPPDSRLDSKLFERCFGVVALPWRVRVKELLASSDLCSVATARI